MTDLTLTERDLERLLRQGALRLRLNAALRWACLGLGLALLGAAALVALAKGWHAWEEALRPSAWLLAVLLPVLAAIGALRARPQASAVALKLDRSAGLDEHLTTWAEFHGKPAPADPDLRSFVSAQCKATLRRAKGLEASRAIPLRLPAWSRALLLGFLALGCALLMPQRQEALRRAGAAALDGAPTAESASGSSGKLGPLSGKHLPKNFRVQVVKDAEMPLIKAMSIDPDLPKEEKAKLLEDLMARVGAVPENDLTDELQEIIHRLRKQVEPADADPAKDGAVQASDQEPPNAAGSDVTPPATAPAARTPAQLLELIGDRFPDVHDALQRYYGATGE